jgi:hypothetical protein
MMPGPADSLRRPRVTDKVLGCGALNRDGSSIACSRRNSVDGREERIHYPGDRCPTYPSGT